MEISSSANSLYAARAQQSAQPQEQTRTAAAQPAGGDGPDREPDGDKDDGSVTATRGQNLNIIA